MPALYAPDPRPPGWTAIPSQDLDGDGSSSSSGSGLQQVFLNSDGPTDPTKPALRFPSGGGALEQYDPGDAQWH